MKNRIILFLLLFASVVRIHAQTLERQVIGSSGANHPASWGSISASSGEGAISTLAASTVALTQGFEQPNQVTGSYTLCAGSTVTIPIPATNGNWRAANSNASVTGGGVVTGVIAGSDLISYTVTNGTDSFVANYAITVNAVPTATISGTTTICNGVLAVVYLTGTPGALVTCSGGGSVTLNGSGVGAYDVTPTATTTYTISSVTLGGGCTGIGSGSDVVTVVNPLATPTITGATSVCTGATATYTATGTGGTWSTNVVTIASVSPTGVVRGLAAGVNTVVYTNTNACGTVSGQKVFTVNVTPAAATISGAGALCPAGTESLTASVAGGTWVSRTPGYATITSGGVVTAVAAGTDIVSYTAPADACGAAVTSTVTLTVNANPIAGSLSGSTAVCSGATLTVTATVGGGSWSMSNANATIAAGVVTGVSGGLDTVVYTVANACGSASVTRSITITGTPTVAPISVATMLCLEATSPVSDATAGGSWSLTSTAIIDFGSPLRATAVGVATLYYNVSNACHTNSASAVITVIGVPTVSPITGNSPVCTGSELGLSDAASGGTWSSNNPAVATVSGGVVTPITTGTAVIVYSVSNSCGSASTAVTTTVTATPVAATISGTNTVCLSGTTTLTASIAGGTWSSGSATLTVTTGGVVTGHSAGTGVITYTLPGNTCGSAVTTTYSVSVLTAPTAGSISGASTICDGSSSLLTETVSGGAWSSGNTLVASVNGTGSVTAVGVGTAVIIYSVTNACGSASVAATVTVIATPSAATISGATSLCVAGNATLTASVAGGVWSSGTPTVVSVSAAGVVHGYRVGADVISYTIPSTTCSAALTSTYTVSVISSAAGYLTGPISVCQDAAVTFTVTGAGAPGTWTTSNGNTSVTPTGLATGLVTGLAAGTSTVVFTVSNACGTSSATAAITVNGLPVVAPITIGTTSLCLNATTPISESTPGGHWGTTSSTIIIFSNPIRGGAVGTAELYYYVTNACGTTTVTSTITVSACPGDTRDIEGASPQSAAAEGSVSQVRVFPNPSTGMIFIEAPMKVDAKLSSIDGRLLVDQKDVTEIDMNKLANGIYLINVYDNASGLLVKTDRIIMTGN